jgi:hypothetical protein
MTKLYVGYLAINKYWTEWVHESCANFLKDKLSQFRPEPFTKIVTEVGTS